MSLRTYVVLAALLFGPAMAARAQGNAGIRVGYAIITPESGNTAGLGAVETLTLQSLTGAFRTSLAPAPLLTNQALAADLGTTGLAIFNSTATTANVQLSVTDANGIAILNQTFAILPRAQLSRFLTEFFPGQIVPGTGTKGLLTVNSDAPVGVAALDFIGPIFTAVPITSLASPFPLSATVFSTTTTNTASTSVTTPQVTVFPVGQPPNVFTTVDAVNAAQTTGFNTVDAVNLTQPTTITSISTVNVVNPAVTGQITTTVGGAGALIFPQVVTGGPWSTEITVTNTSTAPQIIRIDLFDSSGVQFRAAAGITIPAMGLFTLITP